MAIKLSFGKPRIVAQGPTYEEAGWGTYQFPSISRMDDGRVVLSYHVVPDTTEAYGLERNWAVSSDDGSSWSEVSTEELPRIKACAGTRLPDGKRLRAVVPKPVPISDELHAALKQKYGRRKGCLGIEEIPDGIIEKYKWRFAVSDPDTKEETEYMADLDFPGMTAFLTTGAMVVPFAFGPIRVAPDGSIWIAHYATGRNPDNLGWTSYYACYYLRSTDGGKSFQLQSWIHYRPDTYEFPDAFVAEGFCEPDICFMPDGSVITLMRTGSYAPSYIARSTDNMQTWSRPVQFDRCGVLPQLLRMDCGVTLASYGRIGLLVRASSDPAGMQWEEPYELMPREPKPFRAESCYYTSMLALDDRTALLAYSDFYVPDNQGVQRKSIMVRTIHVEE